MIEKRRSIRRFDGREVTEEDIARMLKAALSAPSSKNSRSSSFMVVDDRELLENMAEMRDFGSAFLKDAPLAVAVMGDETLTDLWVDNAAISATYLQLAAEALGLSSCWVHVNGRLHKKDDPSAGTAAEYLNKILPVPAGRRILCVIAIGYPASYPEPRREDPEIAARVIKL